MQDIPLKVPHLLSNSEHNLVYILRDGGIPHALLTIIMESSLYDFVVAKLDHVSKSLIDEAHDLTSTTR